MPDASVLVLLAAGQLGNPTSSSMVATLESTTNASVIVETFDQVPVEQDAELLGDMLRCRAVAELRWDDEKRSSATIRVFARARGGWIDRKVTFKDVDAPAERGRTIGFAIAALVPEASETPSPPETVHPPTTEPPPPEPSPPSVAKPVVVDRPIAAPAPIAPRAALATLEGFGTFAQVGGTPFVGGAIAVRVPVAPSIEPVIEAGARGARVPQLGASIFDWRFAAGISRWWSTGEAALGLRFDGVLLRESVARRAETHSRFIPGVSLSIRAQWPAASPLAFAAALGIEVVAGESHVVVRDVATHVLPVVRGFGTFGVALRF